MSPNVDPLPPADPATVAEIGELERRWGEAFLTGDHEFLESIIAPEFALAASRPSGETDFMFRLGWMRNCPLFEHRGFEMNMVHVATAGPVAIATVEGLWTVDRRDGHGLVPVRFVVTDTWLRRDGQWQVVWRYSNRLPDAPWPMVAD